MVRSHVASSMAEPSSFCEPWPVTSGVATQELIATVVVVSGWNTIVGEHPLWRLFHAAYIDFRSKKQRISARWHKKKHWKSRVQIINKHCWVFFSGWVGVLKNVGVQTNSSSLQTGEMLFLVVSQGSTSKPWKSSCDWFGVSGLNDNQDTSTSSSQRKWQISHFYSKMHTHAHIILSKFISL